MQPWQDFEVKERLEIHDFAHSFSLFAHTVVLFQPFLGASHLTMYIMTANIMHPIIIPSSAAGKTLQAI